MPFWSVLKHPQSPCARASTNGGSTRRFARKTTCSCTSTANGSSIRQSLTKNRATVRSKFWATNPRQTSARSSPRLSTAKLPREVICRKSATFSSAIWTKKPLTREVSSLYRKSWPRSHNFRPSWRSSSIGATCKRSMSAAPLVFMSIKMTRIRPSIWPQWSKAVRRCPIATTTSRTTRNISRHARR